VILSEKQNNIYPLPLMEYSNGSGLERSGSDLKPRTWIQEMEIDAARALAYMAVTEPDQQVVGISLFVCFQFLICTWRSLSLW
jgi:hypothetical protein